MIKKMMNLLKNWFGGKCMPMVASEAKITQTNTIGYEKERKLFSPKSGIL